MVGGVAAVGGKGVVDFAGFVSVFVGAQQKWICLGCACVYACVCVCVEQKSAIKILPINFRRTHGCGCGCGCGRGCGQVELFELY